MQNLDPNKEPKNEAPDLSMIKSAVAELNPGEVSEFIPTASGGVVAILQKRDPIDPAQYNTGKALFDARYLRGKQTIVLYDWLRDRRREAGMPIPTVS